MGVTGLWTQVKPAASRQTFEKTAFEVFDEAYDELEDGTEIAPGTTLGLRVGIDASAWFFHSEKAEGGANPALRNMFHRVIRLARAGVRALFVFDGPHRPTMKRGHPVWRGKHSIQTDFERIVEAFGFEWRMAPGEAEAELAYLNSRGTLDLVITDDVDCLLFGASTLMKHALINQPTESIHPQLYERGVIELELDITVPGLILVALMSGGDYDTDGLTGIGPKISLALARAGFGERLQEIMTTTTGRDQQARLQILRDLIRHEMRTNESGYFERKAGAVANKFTDAWPDVAVANSYYNAVTTGLAKYKKFDKPHTWSKPIDVPALVAIMDDLFEFIHAEILQKLRSQIWECIIVQDLIRRIRDRNASLNDLDNGSPSKILAASVNSMKLGSPSKSQQGEEASSGVVPHRVEKKRSLPRKAENFITAELQVVIDPAPAATLAQQHLRHPDPNVGKLEARKEAEAAAIRRLHGADHPGAEPAAPRNSHYDDPIQPHKLWIQESLLRMAVPHLVLAWENREQEKLEAKANKGKKAAGTSQTSPKKKKKESTAAKNKTPTKTVGKSKQAARTISSDSEPEDLFPSSSQATSTSQDVFGDSPPLSQNALPSGASTSRSSSSLGAGRIDRTAPIRPVLYKRSKAGESSSSGSSSDSDIVVISSGRTDVRKSPRKSPRKSEDQITARGTRESSQATKPPLLAYPVTKKAEQISVSSKEKTAAQEAKTLKVPPKKQYSYTELDDLSDSSDDDLPPLTDLLKTGGRLKAASTIDSGATASKSSPAIHGKNGITTSRVQPADRPKVPAKSAASATVSATRKPPPKDIIDLCSSD